MIVEYEGSERRKGCCKDRETRYTMELFKSKSGIGLEINRSCFPVFLPDTVRDTFLIDPAVILIVVGVVMFFITFCGCIGALRENIRLLKTVIDLTDTLQILAQCFASI